MQEKRVMEQNIFYPLNQKLIKYHVSAWDMDYISLVKLLFDK